MKLTISLLILFLVGCQSSIKSSSIKSSRTISSEANKKYWRSAGPEFVFSLREKFYNFALESFPKKSNATFRYKPHKIQLTRKINLGGLNSVQGWDSAWAVISEGRQNIVKSDHRINTNWTPEALYIISPLSIKKMDDGDYYFYYDFQPFCSLKADTKGGKPTSIEKRIFEVRMSSIGMLLNQLEDQSERFIAKVSFRLNDISGEPVSVNCYKSFETLPTEEIYPFSIVEEAFKDLIMY